MNHLTPLVWATEKEIEATVKVPQGNAEIEMK